MTTFAVRCWHHWIIGKPIAGVAHGRCRRCYKERDFTQAGENTDVDTTSRGWGHRPLRDVLAARRVA